MVSPDVPMSPLTDPLERIPVPDDTYLYWPLGHDRYRAATITEVRNWLAKYAGEPPIHEFDIDILDE